MLLNTQELKQVTDKILSAVDSSDVSNITETLELEVKEDNLYVNVTNKEYFVRVKLFLGYTEDFHVSVNANLFLKLISQITTEDIELTCDESSLHIKGNGNYKLPLIYDGDKLLTLPKIVINNPTVNMDIETSILNSILKYNSKEMLKGLIAKPVQKMYYVDEQGAITFTTGACVNKFSLEKPIKILLNSKIVKLFKLFTGDKVNFTLGYDALSNEIVQTKVCFEDNSTQLTAILQCDDSMLRSVPVHTIRGLAENVYPYSVTVGKNSLIQAINRLMVLSDRGVKGSFITAKFIFDKDKLTIKDNSGENVEELNYVNICNNIEAPYETIFDLNDIKLTLQICEDAYITLNFGDSNALVLARTNILNVIPECHK